MFGHHHWAQRGREDDDCHIYVDGAYRNLYSRVYVFSPSCAEGVDSAWDAWRRHVRINMKVTVEEQTLFSTWQPDILEKLIERPAQVNAHLKAKQSQEGVRNFGPS